jgi:alpha-beta hydrolase superfamily lysophospholipase
MFAGVINVNETIEFLTMTDGFKLFARHWAPLKKADKTIVCIHGLGGCSGCFKHVGVGLAARGIDVWSLDLRGFGNSKEDGIPRGDTKNFQRHMQDIDEAVHNIRSISNCKKFFLLGHSLGGLYVLWYGATYPQAVDGLVLVAPSVEIKPIMTPEERAKFILAAASSPETMINTGRIFLISVSTEIAQYMSVTSSFSVRYFMGLRRFLMQDNIFVNASKDKKSTLILQGDADEDALPVGAKRLFESIPTGDKKLEVIPGANHNLYGTIFSVRAACSEDNPKKREFVISLVYDWLVEH